MAKSKSYTASESFVGEEWNDKMSSLKVEAYGKSGLSGDYKLQNRNSGKFLDLDNNNTDNKTAIVQYDDEYIDATQIWTLTEIGGEKGVYSICTSVNKRQGIDVADWSKNDGARCNSMNIAATGINSSSLSKRVMVIINLFHVLVVK